MDASEGDCFEIDPPRGVRGSRLVIEQRDWMVLSYPVARPSVPAMLTSAEREVCVLLHAGLTQAEIGRCRSTSKRTVANQIAAIFRKLKVSSRAELLALLCTRRA